MTKDCSQDEIKRAYRTLARTHHPDRGGDANMFQQIHAAHEILSDPGSVMNVYLQL